MIWVEGATNWNHWKEVNKQESSEAPVSWMVEWCCSQSVRKWQWGSDRPDWQSHSVPPRLRIKVTFPEIDDIHLEICSKRPEKGRIGKSWVASSCLAVSDLLRSRKGRLVCKACQWFVWFVAGFSCCYNNSETKIRCSVRLPAPGPEARLTWLDLKPNPWMPTVAASVAAILYKYT